MNLRRFNHLLPDARVPRALSLSVPKSQIAAALEDPVPTDIDVFVVI